MEKKEERKVITREELQAHLQERILTMEGLRELSEKGYEVLEVLCLCEAEEIKICQKGKAVEAWWLLDAYKQLLEQSTLRQRKRQEEGIKKALKKKQEGTGGYGRPTVKLPADFEQQVRRKLENRESLAQYCETLNIKRSTFYKWTRYYKQKWKEEQLGEWKKS